MTLRRTVLACLAALLVGAAPAYAHAELMATDPAAGATLATPPKAVTLRFSEPVEAAFGAIRVYDSNSRRVDDGNAHHPNGKSSAVTVALRDLAPGGYVVTWRVISADSHPVHGAFTFRVGTGTGSGDTGALAKRLLAQEGGSALVGGLFAVVRLLAFAALLLLLGGALFVVGLWHDARSLRLLRIAAVTTAATGIIGIGLQGAYAGALPLVDAARPAVVKAVLHTRFGEAWAARAVLAVVALVLIPAAIRGRTARIAAGITGLGLLLTVAMAGHAGAGDLVPLTMVSDVVHVGAAAAWLGGLAVLCLCALPARAVDVVPRFSRLAFGCVVTLLVTGSFQSWRQVGTLPALWHTTYGVLLLAKLACFAGLVALGALGRSWVRNRHAADSADIRTIKLSVGAEVAVGVVVLGLTALLVNAQPARTAYAKPFSATLTTATMSINVVVDPAKAGRSIAIHAYTLTPQGQIAEVVEFTGALRLPDRDIGPITIPFQRAGPGHFVASAVDVPLPGRWTLDLTARISEVDQITASTTVRFR